MTHETLGIRVVRTNVGEKLHLSFSGWEATLCQHEISAETALHGGPDLCRLCVERVSQFRFYKYMELFVDKCREVKRVNHRSVA